MQLNALTSAAELANIENLKNESDMASILSKITFFVNIVSAFILIHISIYYNLFLLSTDNNSHHYLPLLINTDLH